MKHFRTIEKLDTGILYAVELASSLSILLLAFGLIASMANVLTQGAILSDNISMQRIWAVTQCVAIDFSIAGVIVRTFQYYQQGEKVKTSLYALLSCLLLFTAAIVLNIESVQQTLNITLEAAYVRVFIPVGALIWIRSVAIVLLIVAHAMRHVQLGKPQEPVPGRPQEQTPLKLEVTPELVAADNGHGGTARNTADRSASLTACCRMFPLRRSPQLLRRFIQVFNDGTCVPTSSGEARSTRRLSSQCLTHTSSFNHPHRSTCFISCCLPNPEGSLFCSCNLYAKWVRNIVYLLVNPYPLDWNTA